MADLGMTSFCLNMIVKNEAQVIERCLASIRPWVQRWCIVDTGSNDGTQAIVRRCMAGVPGGLYERPWRNFAHNRNEALRLAMQVAAVQTRAQQPRGNYLLFIDADETLVMPSGFVWPALAADGYRFDCHYDQMRYQRNALVSTRLAWQWQGVIHEYLDCAQPHAWDLLAGPHILVRHDGARARDPQTYLRDVALLEQATRDEPNNSRYVFYLAQSLGDCGQLDAACNQYLKRAQMGGWEEERWYAQFRAAQLAELLGQPTALVQGGYLAAYQARPGRAEPLYELARYHRQRREFDLAYLFAQKAAELPATSDSLFVDASVCAWRALDEMVVASSYISTPSAQAEGRAGLQKLLADNTYPDTERARIEANKTCFGL